MRLLFRAVIALITALTLALGLASALGEGYGSRVIGYAQRAPERFDLFFHDLTFNLRVNLTRTPDLDEPEWDWSPAQSRLVFTRAAPGQSQICTLQVGGSAANVEGVRCLEPLSPADDRPRWSPNDSPLGSPDESPDGSPDGVRLAFLSAGGSLHVANTTNATVERAEGATQTSASESNTTTIATAVATDSVATDSVATTTVATTTVATTTVATTTVATAPLPELIVSAYAWSPEGDRIVAVAADRSSGQGRLVLLELLESDEEGANLRQQPLAPQIENNRAADAPIWSPDGDRVLFPVTAGVGHNILLADLAVGAVEALTTSGDNVNAVWMPDGRGVLFLSWSRSGTTWSLLDLASGRRGTFLFHRQVLDSRPAWSSDGQTLAFASYADQRFSIWTIDLADGHPRMAIVSREELGAPRFVGWRRPPVD